MSQGFDEYDDRLSGIRQPLTFEFVQRRADEVLRRATDWILPDGTSRAPASAATPAQWFAWVHLFDPHVPYDAPEQRVSDPYDNEVAFTDAQLGHALTRLRRAGALDDTLIVVTADHGEDLGDHGELTHGLFAYNSTLKVPLILAGPGIRPAVRQAPVAHVDLLPTILDLLGLEAPPGLQGRSLLAEINGTDTPGSPIYFEALAANLTRNWAPLTGIVVDHWKFIDLPIPELYDIEADPGETTNLFDRDRARSRTLRARLTELRTELAGSRTAARAPLDADALSRLRALGYTTGRVAGRRPARPFTDADDPKTLLEVHVMWSRVLREVQRTLTSSGGREAAVQRLRETIARHPHFAPAYAEAANLLVDLGRPSEAVALLDEASGRHVHTAEITHRLGTALPAAGDPARAAVVLEPLVAASPAWADDVNKLGVAYVQLGRLADARRQFQRAVAIDPAATETWRNLGMVEMQRGKREDAARAFRQLTRVDPSYGPGWKLLGAALAKVDPAGAIAAWRRAVQIAPDDLETLLDLAVLLADSTNPEAARPYLERYLAVAPSNEHAARVRRILSRLNPD